MLLLHITPKIWCPFSTFRTVELIDLKIEPLGLHLRDSELVARRPCPNKLIAVACRRQGRAALNGILIETPRPSEDKFTCITRWAILGEFLATHRVDYRLLDDDYDAASDDMTLWHGYVPELIGVSPLVFKGWTHRYPAWVENLPPVAVEPKMEFILAAGYRACPSRQIDKGTESSPRLLSYQKFLAAARKNTRTDDVFSDGGRVVTRRQEFAMPTIERERITAPNPITQDMRMPAPKTAFRVLESHREANRGCHE